MNFHQGCFLTVAFVLHGDETEGHAVRNVWLEQEQNGN